MVLYSYATMDEAFLLDENLSIITSAPHKGKDLLSIQSGELASSEKTVTAGKEGVVYCNYKKDFTTLTDYVLLAKIIEKCKQKVANQEQFRLLATTKIRTSVHWDTILCQAIRSIEEIDKSINLLAKRLREWYEWHNPEFSRSIPTHEQFAEMILTASSDELYALVDINAEDSMGAPFTDADKEPMLNLAKEIVALKALRESTTLYIHAQMKQKLPNFTAIAGAQVGSKILSMCGTVERLVKMTASTLQVLGAEKALFRHLKTGARPPKYGLLFQHQTVAKVRPANRGKVARTIANALTLAVKTDYFNVEKRDLGIEKMAEIEAKIRAEKL